MRLIVIVWFAWIPLLIPDISANACIHGWVLCCMVALVSQLMHVWVGIVLHGSIGISVLMGIVLHGRIDISANV